MFEPIDEFNKLECIKQLDVTIYLYCATSYHKYKMLALLVFIQTTYPNRELWWKALNIHKTRTK